MSKITIDFATGVSIPSESVTNRKKEILKREIKICLFNYSTSQFIGNTITVPATWKSQEEDRWYFHNH